MEWYIYFILNILCMIGILVGLRNYKPNGNFWESGFMNILFLVSLAFLIDIRVMV